MSNYRREYESIWSCDGHEKNERIIFKTNKTKEELIGAHQKLVALGFDIKKVCDEYEEPYLYPNDVKLLESLGAKLPFDVDEENEDGKTLYIYNNEIFILLMEALKTQIPDLVWKKVSDETEDIYEFQGIGYGCFY